MNKFLIISLLFSSLIFSEKNIESYEVKIIDEFKINKLLPGKITPKRQSILGFEISGKLKKVIVDIGDKVKVKNGFGRNFLIPQKLAITFSKSQLKQVEEKRSQEDRKIDRQKDVLLDLLSKVADLDITIKMNSEDGAKLFGSVTKLDIEKLFKRTIADKLSKTL